jgi:hypothetical protein
MKGSEVHSDDASDNGVGTGVAGPRCVLIHAGAHKTGTTSLQAVFTRNRGALRAAGILYPTSGVLPNDYEADAHTNLAWELMGHGSFEPRNGTLLDDLMPEVTSTECQKVLLSSEEFARLFNKPWAMQRLKDEFCRAGFDPHVALVFRDVAEYADAMFTTLVGHGLLVGYSEYSRCVREDHGFTIKGNTYCFDRELLVRSFAEVFGGEAVTCIDYHPDDAVRPFLDAFKWFFGSALDGADLGIRANTTMDRVEALRESLRAAEARIAGLEAEVGELTTEIEHRSRHWWARNPRSRSH